MKAEIVMESSLLAGTTGQQGAFLQSEGTVHAKTAFPRPLRPPPGGGVINLSIKPPLTVIAKPVLTLAVAIHIPVLFPFRPQRDEETDCHDRFAVSQ